MNKSISLIVACVAPWLALNTRALDITPNFADVPTGWVTDRYQPHSFSDVGTYQGRNNVLGIQITAAEGLTSRPTGDQFTFYNTQGMQHPLSGGAGSVISADLYIPGSWSDPANGSVRTDMWGVMSDGSSVSDYPIIGFSNYGGAARYRIWDENLNGGSGGWVDLSTPVKYDAWTSFSLDFTGSSYIYSIDGTPVFTDSEVNGTTGFQAIIMQAYNFFGDTTLSGANPVAYTAYWSNSVPDVSGSLGLLGLGAGALVGLRRRLKV